MFNSSVVEERLFALTGAKNVTITETIQQLWSGYGTIFRVNLVGCDVAKAVVKYVRYPSKSDHPMGWRSDFAHQRKVRSYLVETAWYQQYASRCDVRCRVPACLAAGTFGDELVLVLEDLDTVGYGLRKYRLSTREISITLRWLAWFHATFMGYTPEQLWANGTYWHLDTRPDEWHAMSDEPLKQAAAEIDAKLSNTAFGTFVHGDAKVANFCFSRRGERVAAVDFQYVGGGCGVKDVAYFLDSCMYADDCERFETAVLDEYFFFLKEAMNFRTSPFSFASVEREWRELYHWARVDFYRFMKGWCEERFCDDDYSERLQRKVLAEIGLLRGER